MDQYLMVINVVLAGVSLSAVLWAVRLRAVMVRLEQALHALRDGHRQVRIGHRPEDTEPVLREFDLLAEELERESSQPSLAATRTISAEEIWLPVNEMLRPPLLTMQGVAQLLQQQLALLDRDGEDRGSSSPDDWHRLRDGLSGLAGQAEALCQLVADPHQAAERSRQGGSADQVTTDRDHWQREVQDLGRQTVLVIDFDGASAQSLLAGLSQSPALALRTEEHLTASSLIAALTPRAVVINLGLFSDDTSRSVIDWRGFLGQLVPSLRMRPIELVMYQAMEDPDRARFMAPDDIWIWPTDASLGDRAGGWVSPGWSARVIGDAGLSARIAGECEREGIKVLPVRTVEAVQHAAWLRVGPVVEGNLQAEVSYLVLDDLGSVRLTSMMALENWPSEVVSTPLWEDLARQLVKGGQASARQEADDQASTRDEGETPRELAGSSWTGGSRRPSS